MGIDESPDRFIDKPTIQKNHRFLFWPFGTLRAHHLGRRVLRALSRTQHNRFESRTGAMDTEGRALLSRCERK